MKIKNKNITKKFKDWDDYTNFIDLLVMKLEYDAWHYENKGHCDGSDNIAKQMKECAKYLKKCADDMNYSKETNCNWEEMTVLQRKDLEKALGIIKDNLFSWWD